MEQPTIFKETLGDSPIIRVLDFLLEGRGLDYSLSNIAENSNIGWTILHRIWDKMLKSGLVVPTRDIGRAKLFKLNEENPAVKGLIKFYDTLLFQHTKNYLSRKVIVKF